MKKIIILLFLSLASLAVHAQSTKKLYKYYHAREFVKCVEKCDVAIQKNPDFYEAYYIKAISYFEMAQLPQRYTDFTKDPLMDCLRTLSVLRTKDTDGVTFDEHADTLAMIYQYCDMKAQELRNTNKEKAIVMYQRLMRAYNIQTNALEVAIIYAKVGDYEKCMSQVSRLYDKSKPEINASHPDYDALTKGALLLAEHWMFRDLFWIIETYKSKYELNHAISQGFKKALKISIDTARTDDDKTLFTDFSKRGAELYPNDTEILNHIEKRWIELIDANVKQYRATAGNRTWRDSVMLRNTYKYLESAKSILPQSTVFHEMEKKLNAEFHTIPFSFEIDFFRLKSLEIVNRYRSDWFVCDTGNLVKMFEAPPLQWNTILENLAQEHAKDMFCNNFTDNINPNGETPWDRIKKTDLKGITYENETGLHYIQAMKIGEILGYGFSFEGVYSEEQMAEVIEKMVHKWMNTRLSQNCPKLMNPEFTHMGMAMYGDKWVLFCANIHDIVVRSNKKR